MKLCRACNTKKTAVDFHARSASKDGLAAKCRACQSEYDKARANDPDRLRARMEYRKTPAGKAAVKRAQATYRKTDGAKESATAWRERNQVKRAAHVLVNNALRNGKLVRCKCVKCGRKAQAHHEDYTKPLDVVWLCPKHHKARHIEMQAQGIEP